MKKEKINKSHGYERAIKSFKKVLENKTTGTKYNKK